MRLAALLLAALVLVACDATPTLPAPSWQPVTPAVQTPAAVPVAVPAQRVADAQATLVVAAADVSGAQGAAAVATANALSTEWAYALNAQATRDAIAAEQARISLAVTVAYATSAAGATVRAARHEDATAWAAEVAQQDGATATARAAGTAAHVEATRAAIDADDRQAKVAAGGLALGGIGLGVLVSCLILPVAAYYVALALAEWIKAKARLDNFIETVNGEPLYWDATGRLVPVALIGAPAPVDAQPSLAAPPEPDYTVKGHANGAVTSEWPPIAPPVSDKDRQDLVRLIHDMITRRGAHSQQLAGADELPNWTRSRWVFLTDLLGRALYKKPRVGSFVVYHAHLLALLQDVERGGVHLSYTRRPAPPDAEPPAGARTGARQE